MTFPDINCPFVPGSYSPTAAVSARTGTPMQTVYGATKASLEHFARVWSKELGHSHGTTVNCLNPGALTKHDDARATTCSGTDTHCIEPHRARQDGHVGRQPARSAGQV